MTPLTDKPDTVRALARGLDILRHVNQTGACKVADIATALGLARPTVYRLLETLEQQGYVSFSATSARVRVTRLAASLGDGYAATSELCQVAGPLLARYADQIVWPLDLTVYDNAAMVIQETTHSRNPLSIDHGMTGYRLPILRTSAGRCYLGFCPDEERTLILRQVAHLGEPDDLPYLQDRYLDQMVGEVTRQGYGTRFGQEFRPKTASIAVPVMSAGRVVCCLSVIWTRAAMTPAEAVARMLSPMRDLSADIARAMDS